MIIPNFTKNNVKNRTTKKEENNVYQFKKNGELTFSTSEKGFISEIDIEIADNDEERANGLMFRTEMKENQGMLFIFERDEPQSFWMRNTYISLDMIFVNSAFEIVTIHKNTETTTDKNYPSTKLAKYVIEVNGGYCDKFGIKQGDKIAYRTF